MAIRIDGDFSDDPESSASQTMEINVLAMPDGASYRVAKTVANGNWFFGNATALSLGLNTVSVAAVSFDRSVKFQFSSGDVEFDLLTVNAETLSCASDLDGVPMADCAAFDEGPNATWPHVITATTPDDPGSSSAQTMNILVSALPADGANYRVVKTVANGNWNNGNAMALNIGMNEVTVSAVSFARSVKFQFSSGAVEVVDIAINGTSIACEVVPCDDLDADGICDDVDDCVGVLDALGICNGTCLEDANANGICDADEDFVDPSTYCGPGTTWDAAAGQCVGVDTCMGDFDGDGTIATSDLLGFLAIFLAPRAFDSRPALMTQSGPPSGGRSYFWPFTSATQHDPTRRRQTRTASCPIERHAHVAVRLQVQVHHAFEAGE